MSLPQWAFSRKPRRLGLWAPFILALIVAAMLAGAWMWTKSEVERRMDVAHHDFASSGWILKWDRRSIHGFPFRLDVDLDGVRVREPSGWGVSASRLKAEASVFSPLHWVAFAPSGVVVARRTGGPLRVAARILRASVSSSDATPPRISVEGLDLKFTAPTGAVPFLLQSAKALHFHTQAGPHDQGAIYVEIDQAAARPDTLFGGIAEERLSNLEIEGIFSQAGALRGRDWVSAGRSWSAAAGQLSIKRLRISAGYADVVANSGELAIGPDGRLKGVLNLTFRGAQKTLDATAMHGALQAETARMAEVVAVARQIGPTVSLPLMFEAGRATLGPVAIGPAPRIY